MKPDKTPLKPLEHSRRSSKEVVRWQKIRSEWMAELEPSFLFQRLFDHIPGVYFFAKNRSGHLMFASDGLLKRYEMRDDSEFIGRTDFDINPEPMAQAYVDDDKRILAGETDRVLRIELWWDPQGIPDWFLVTKLPLYDRRRRVQGVMGILRRPAEAERQLPVFQNVARAVEIMRRDYAKEIVISDIAELCGQSVRQLQRRFQSAFGISPQEFLLKTRVLAAVRLLEETRLSNAEIAHRCGFVDGSSFSQHFRRRMGMTPRMFRKRM